MRTENNVPSPPPGYALRAPTLADAGEIAALINTCAIDVLGRGHTTEEWQRGLMRAVLHQGKALDTCYLLVAGPSGDLLGYASLDDDEPGEIYFECYVHPHHWQHGLAEWLLAEVERRARAGGGEARVGLLTPVWAGAAQLRDSLEARGYRTVRHSRRLDIELDEAPPPPTLPPGVTLRCFVPGQDERATYEVWAEAFSDHWSTSQLSFDEFLFYKIENEPSFDPGLWLLAVEGEQVVGAALCRWERPGDPNFGHVRDLGVRRSHRRRGIARALLHALFGEFYRRGKPRVSLGVDGLNESGANQLYESAGMHEVYRVYAYKKLLHPTGDLESPEG